MKQRTIGTTGPEVSIVGLGCNNFGMRLDASASAGVVHAALDEGITHFDTAEMYGDGASEEHLGRAPGRHRDNVIVATKYLPRPADEPYRPGMLAERIRQGCEGSLRRLGTDHIDVYYQHIPDPEAPVDEALEALTELVNAGKVLHLAESNISATQIDRAAMVAEEKSLRPFAGVQVEWNLLARSVESAIVPAATRHGLGVIPYFPLASGLLTGKYQRGTAAPEGSRLATGEEVASSEVFDTVEALTKYAEDRDRTLIELSFGWLLAHPEVPSVIAGATRPEQVRSNVASASWLLTQDERDEIAALTGAYA